MIRVGDIVTPAFLIEYFRRAIVHLNNVLKIVNITTGQVLDTSNGGDENILNQFSEQYFDNQKDYLGKYYEDLNEIEGGVIWLIFQQ